MEYFVFALGIAIALAGVIYTRIQARKSVRGKIRIDLSRAYEIRPSSFEPDLSQVLQLTFAGRPIDNFICLVLSMKHSGYRDYEDLSARSPPEPGGSRRPGIDFQNLHILAFGTQNNDPNAFEIPLTKANSDRSLYLNVIRLRSGAEARFNILCTRISEDAGITATFLPGYMKEIDLEPSGLLQTPS